MKGKGSRATLAMRRTVIYNGRVAQKSDVCKHLHILEDCATNALCLLEKQCRERGEPAYGCLFHC